MAVDRRVKYTKMALQNSLIGLLKEKPIARITVKEICQQADVNRATFYAHYADQFDQLRQIEIKFVAEINAYLDGYAAAEGEKDVLATVEKIFEYVQANAELCRVLLGNNGNIDFQDDVIQIISARVLDLWKTGAAADKDLAEYAFVFIANGSVGIIRRWLFGGPESLTPKMLAALIVKLAYSGLDYRPGKDGSGKSGKNMQ